MQTSSRVPTGRANASPDGRILDLTPLHRAYVWLRFISIATPIAVMSALCLTSFVVFALQLVGLVEASLGERFFASGSLSSSISCLLHIARKRGTTQSFTV